VRDVPRTPIRLIALPVGVAALLLALPRAASAVPPTNDNFANRSTIPSVPFEATLSTAEATTEPGEPESPCGRIGKTVWYQYTPPADVVLRAHTRGSGFDTMLAVWTGASIPTLTPVGCSDDIFEAESRVVFQAEAGTTYLFQVGGYRGDSGTARFLLQPVEAGMITGSVTAETSGGALAGICVSALDADFGPSVTDVTDSMGTYRVAVRPGRYLVVFRDQCDQANDHRTEWFNDRMSFQTADEVAVVGTSTVDNIDAALAPSCPGFGDSPRPQFIGTPGPDTFVGGPEAEIFCGMEGPDRMAGGGGRDFILGSEGRDRLAGGEGSDLLTGGGERDALSGGADNDRLVGEEGRDRLAGGGGNDDLFGGRDSDVLGGGSGDRDRCDGGRGRDRATRACERLEDVP
jgi:RTX calcium-binding nonapeptide repeat (4 copies)